MIVEIFKEYLRVLDKVIKEIFFVIILLFLLIPILQAEEINITYIMKIESSGNNKAVSDKGAIGLCQITPICLKEYNNYHKNKYSKEDLYNEEINWRIANWYYNIRIPQMLKYYNIEDTIDNRIIAYNWGIKNLISWLKEGGDYNKLPGETRGYIEKYRKMLSEEGGER